MRAHYDAGRDPNGDFGVHCSFVPHDIRGSGPHAADFYHCTVDKAKRPVLKFDVGDLSEVADIEFAAHLGNPGWKIRVTAGSRNARLCPKALSGDFVMRAFRTLFGLGALVVSQSPIV